MPARRQRSWWTAVLVLLLAAVALALLGALSNERPVAPSRASSESLQRAGLGLLPVAARGPLSAALGADSAAYRVGASAGGFQAHSPAQGVSARFDRSGVELSSDTVKLGLSLRAIGDGVSLRALAPVAPTASANRVSYVRAGVSEWYANGPAGIEQGFTIERAPSTGAHRALTLSLAVATDAHARLARDGRSVSFSGARGGALRYGALSATDASGRALPASIALGRGTVLLRLDTRGARYPLRIDPLIEQGGKLTGTGASGEVPPLFGISTALSADGNTALIAGTADGNFRGAVWVFTRVGAEWLQQGEKLTGDSEGEPAQEQCAEEPGESEDCTFGISVAISADGNTALIGDPSASTRHGTAIVFSRSGSTWKQIATLAGGNESDEGRFGKSVALSADGATALIGDPSGEGGHGVAWVFSRSGSVWSTPGQPIWARSEPGTPHVGRSVALSADGNTALIGAPADDHGVGSARVFARVGSTWTPEGEPLTGQNELGEARFGRTVALSGDGATALISGPSDNDGFGAVWVFTRSGAAFTPQGGKLIGSKASGEAHFGYSAALSSDGNTALIGAPREHTGTGAVSVLKRSGSAWTEMGEQLAGAEASGKGWSGAAVALSGDGETALIGAPRDGGRAGAAWVFDEESAPTRAPIVTNVQPGAGPSSGGSIVTISGANFTGATAVAFGATGATTFTVESATTITAVTPAESRGVVHVTVTTHAGTSAEGEDDQFRFEGKAEPSDPAGSSDPPPQSASGGVLGFTASSASTGGCKVSLRNKHLAVRLHSIAALRLVRTGTGACRGTVALLHKTKTKGKHFKMQTIGTSAFSFVAGGSEVVKITLNKLGRTLFRTHHGRLNVSLSIVRRVPAPVSGRTASVRLTWQKTPRSKATAK
jgi:hypothetical protein